MALTLNNLIGFETGGLEEALATVHAPFIQEAFKRTGDYALRMQDVGDQYDFAMITGGAGDGGDDRIVGFALAHLNCTVAGDIFSAHDDGGTLLWRLQMNADNTITTFDANGANLGTSAVVAGGWHFFEVRWQHVNAGLFDLWIDGDSEIDHNNADMNAAGAISADTAYYRIERTATVMWYTDDIYCYSGAAGTGDFLGDAEVFRYQANTNSATPDTGDDLDYGDPNALWQEVGTTPGDADEIGYAAYPTTGAVYTDDVENGKHYRHGPHGDANIDGTIAGAKFLHQLRGVGAGDYYKRYGNDGDGLTDVMTVLTTSYVNYFTVSELATVVPLATEHFALGIKNVDERKDLRCKGMWAFILHVPSGVLPPGIDEMMAAIGQQTGGGGGSGDIMAHSRKPPESIAY